MTEKGFIKISRKMISWGWFKDVNTAHLFIYCLMRANYKDAEWKGVKVKRGSFITSLKHMSEETGLTPRQVRTALKHLISTKEVTKYASAKNTVIIVNNYDKYQSSDTVNGTKTTKYRQSTDKVATKHRQSSDKVATTDKKNKKYSPPIREENTAHAPERSDGAGLGAKRKPGEVVSWEEFIRFARSVPGSSDYTASDFHNGFVKSHTYFPDDWQNIFRRLTAAPQETQWKFLDDLKAGAYRDKWGCVD